MRTRLAAAAWCFAAAAAVAAPPAERLAVCDGCHGPGGRSTTAGTPSLAAQPRQFTENQLVIIREGLRDVPVMKPFVQGLSDAEIRALAEHYAAQPAPRATPPKQRPRAERGAALARRLLCGSCHLADYAGQQQVPRVAAQDEAYLVASMKQFRDRPGPGRDTIMAATLRGLSDDDLADLAHHLAHFVPAVAR